MVLSAVCSKDGGDPSQMPREFGGLENQKTGKNLVKQKKMRVER